MCTWYGLKRPVIASTASYTADWTIALSRRAVAPGWEGTPAIVCMAIAFQSVTASACTTDDVKRASINPSGNTQNLFSRRISCFLSPEGSYGWAEAKLRQNNKGRSQT